MAIILLFALVAGALCDYPTHVRDPASFRVRDPSTYNFTEAEEVKFREARALATNGTVTVFSTSIRFSNGVVRLYFDTQDNFKRIQMALEGPFYYIQLFSPSIIDQFFKDLDRCYRPGSICTRCEVYATGHCQAINQWDTNWLASICYEPPAQFNGILLMNVLHVSCRELQTLHAMSRLRFASEYV